mgnify:CR=1 FL=1
MITFQIAKGLDQNPDARLIRSTVFEQEQGFTMEFDDIDADAYHIVVYDEETPVATGRTFPKPGDTNTYLIGRVAVLKPWRGKHLGTLILEQLEKTAKKQGAVWAELSAQLQAKGFYEKLGYQAFGEEYKDEFCPHIAMKRKLQ